MINRYNDQNIGLSGSLDPESSEKTQEFFSRSLPSAHTESQGNQTASHFIIPRIRGHNQPLTEVYIEDVLLHDPYTGLPLASDLNVLAFDQMSLDFGLAPESGTQPVGRMVFSWDDISRNATRLGGGFGRPYGHSFFGRLKRKHWFGDSLVKSRVFMERHVTQGSYSYRSDEGTPYNSADDKTRNRSNNHRSATQWLPVVEVLRGSHTVRLFSLIQSARQGLPAINQNLPSLAEYQDQRTLLHLSYKRRLARDRPLNQIAMGLLVDENDRITKDPTGAYMPTTPRSETQVKQGGVHLRLDGGNAESSYLMKLENRSSKILVETEDGRNRYLRVATKLNMAGRIGSFVELRPRVTLQALNQSAKGSDNAIYHGYAASALKRIERQQFEFEASYHQFPVSLFHRFGDGAGVMENEELKPESVKHVQFCWKTGAGRQGVQTSLTIFQDISYDKVTLAPVFSNAARAMNLEKTRIAGLELEGAGGSEMVGLRLAYSLLDPIVLTGPYQGRRVPRVSRHTAVVEPSLRQAFGSSQLSINFQSIFRSRTFRDPGNDIIVPSYNVHHLHLRGIREKVELHLSITNLADLRTMEIESSDGIQRGHTSYQEVDGHPLPGRSFQVGVQMEL